MIILKLKPYEMCSKSALENNINCFMTNVERNIDCTTMSTHLKKSL